MTICPKECPDRHPGCHDHCERYAENKTAYQKLKQECDEIEVVGVMSVTSDLNAGKGRLCWRIPLKERALKFVKEAIKNGRKKAH